MDKYRLNCQIKKFSKKLQNLIDCNRLKTDYKETVFLSKKKYSYNQLKWWLKHNLFLIN